MDSDELLSNKITFSISLMQPKTGMMNIIRATVRKADSFQIFKRLH